MVSDGPTVAAELDGWTWPVVPEGLSDIAVLIGFDGWLWPVVPKGPSLEPSVAAGLDD